MNQDITYLKGVGEKRAKLYNKLGIFTVSDLLHFYPRGYIDFSSPLKIAEITDGEPCIFSGTVTRKLKPYISPRYSIYRAVISDGSCDMLLTFFNSEFIFARLEENKEYLFYGTVTGDLMKKECSSPQFISADSANRIIPKYPLTKGLSQNMISGNLKNALDLFDEPDILNAGIREKYGLTGIKEALKNIHFPENDAVFAEAKKRLAFEELLVLQLGLLVMKNHNRKKTGIKMRKTAINEFYRALPYKPTGAQIRSINECINDMTKSVPMNRLLQGDVGSGKTLVAAALCLFSAKNGCQSTMMAPTEILAKQHSETLSTFLNPLGISVAVLLGSMTAKEKTTVKKHIKNGDAQVVVGTQALIQKDVEFERLGLVITDEQHRFGVNQRSALIEKGENPHNLIISATPIPRTLALMIYADLDISLLDEMPKGRVPIKTYGVDSSYRPRLYSFIRKYVSEGKQAYIVCPMIEKGENDSEKAAATAYYEELKKNYFSDIPIGLLHGKMKQNEKNDVMSRFKNNEISVLVSTTVIEVGVDVPNAVIMLIENAEQFGLSQLHQLRGRVGRGNVQSHCVLLTDSKSDYSKARIDAMVKTCDGFKIANTDLELRGPGDFFGSRQHGFPELKIADMTEDMKLIKTVQELAKSITENDETLSDEKNSGLKKSIEELFRGGNSNGFS